MRGGGEKGEFEEMLSLICKRRRVLPYEDPYDRSFRCDRLGVGVWVWDRGGTEGQVSRVQSAVGKAG